MKAKLTLTLVALAAFALPAAAQTETKVLTGKDLTESALVDALAPADEGIRTRSFKRDQPLAPAKPKSASLLITFETNSAELTQQDTARVHHWLLRQGRYSEDLTLQLEKLDLETVAKAYGLNPENAHHALADAFLTAQVWQKMLVTLQNKGIISLKKLLKIGGAK